MTLQSQKEGNRMIIDRDKNNIEREKLQVQREIADKQLQVAQTNKNRFDNKNSKDKK
jgi:hypothetical protein